MMTEEQIVARLLAGRLDKPRQPAPPKRPEEKAKERFAEANKPTENMINDATRHVDAAARRMEQERKEMTQWIADGQDPRIRYQREIDQFMEAQRRWEASLDDDYVEIGGFREPRYKTTCHRGRGDPDYGTY
jgi:hypothetical protein